MWWPRWPSRAIWPCLCPGCCALEQITRMTRPADGCPRICFGLRRGSRLSPAATMCTPFTFSNPLKHNDRAIASSARVNWIPEVVSEKLLRIRHPIGLLPSAKAALLQAVYTIAENQNALRLQPSLLQTAQHPHLHYEFAHLAFRTTILATACGSAYLRG